MQAVSRCAASSCTWRACTGEWGSCAKHSARICPVEHSLEDRAHGVVVESREPDVAVCVEHRLARKTDAIVEHVGIDQGLSAYPRD